MTIYFVQAGKDGPIKIGYALNVARRMVTLQAGCPQTLHLINTIPGDRSHEAAAHRLFAQHRINREWFRFHPDMTQSNLVLSPENNGINELVSEAVRLVGGQTALAKLCGKKQGHVSYWLSSDHVSAETAVLIDKATKGVVSKKRLRPDLFDDSEAA